MIVENIQIKNISPVELYGVNNSNIDLIRSLFPKLKIVARDDTVKVIGNADDIALFKRKLSLMTGFYNKFNKLNTDDIINLVNEGRLPDDDAQPDVVIFGDRGKIIKAKTPTQHTLVEKYKKNDLLFAVGPAGSGKTYMAVALAVKSLRNREVNKIILSRPAVEAGENLGFLPGDLKEKIDPYLQPLYDALSDMINPRKLNEYMTEGTIQIAPLAFMRGRTLHNAAVVLDEAQNTTSMQMKMFLTRMGENSKFIVTGDITQVDLPSKQKSGLIEAFKILKNIKGIATVMFNENDIVRHPLVKSIVKAYTNQNDS